MKTKSRVAVLKADGPPDGAALEAMVREAVRLSGGLDDIVRPGAMVIIKPNLVVPAPPERGATTDPGICRVKTAAAGEEAHERI